MSVVAQDARELGDERVLVVGAGALGSLYGAYLARAGHDVQLLGREPHVRAVRRSDGLNVEGAAGHRWRAPVKAEWQPDRLEDADVVIVLTKTPDTKAALGSIGGLVDGVKLALSLQNGLDKDDVVASWCGAERTIGGASMVGATLVEPGLVRHTFVGPTFVGELPSGRSARVDRLATMLSAAGLEAHAADHIRSVEWSKLVQVLPAMSVTALTRRFYHETMLTPELAEVFVQLVHETAAVARASGVEVADWPAMLPVGTLSAMDPADAIGRIREFGHELVRRGADRAKPSMLQSVERARHLEVEEIQGSVFRRARELGVDTPAVDVCYRLLAGMDRHHR